MRFALLGDQPDGLDMARALATSGRHELGIYSGPAVGAEYLRRWNLLPARVGDLEEVLADPAIDAVIVAGSPGDRAAQLRRALQSERHVLCVHPLDSSPDSAYEAAMLQADTGRVLVPLLPETLHPGLRRLRQLIRHQVAENISLENVVQLHTAVTGQTDHLVKPSVPLSRLPFRLIEMERWAPEQVLLETDTPGYKPAFPGWDVLWRLGGEVAEVIALAAVEEAAAGEALLLAGRFAEGGLFQVALLPGQPESRWRLAVVTAGQRCELVFPQGWPGPARLTWNDAGGEERQETWDAWNPWPALVEVFEAAVAQQTGPNSISRRLLAPRVPGSSGESLPLTWQEEIRSLELDAAARRSLQRRRASTLEYQEASEEAGFKGTMTLVGCSLIWVTLVLLILSVWLPALGWLILPVLGIFLILQLLRWIVPSEKRKEKGHP